MDDNVYAIERLRTGEWLHLPPKRSHRFDSNFKYYPTKTPFTQYAFTHKKVP